MYGGVRVAPLAAASLLLALGSGGAAGEGDSRPIVYDVTVAGLAHYRDADLSLMTEAFVTRHIDGDTFEVSIADPPWGMRPTEKVRFMGIDTPELGEPLAAEALEHVRRRTGAGPVYLAFDFRRRDRFDRLLAFVYLGDGALLNAELIEAGLAELYRDDDLMYFLAPFDRLEAEARARRPGAEQGRPGAGVVIVTIRNDGRNEHVLLRNDDSVAIDLSGWRIDDDDGDVLAIPPEVSLAPGDTLAVCSGTGCVGTPRAGLRLSNKNIWGNGGDEATLHDRSGTVIDTYTY